MKFITIASMFLVASVVTSIPASAQSPAAPGVEIAKAAMPTPTVMQAFVACMQATNSAYVKTCAKLAEREAKRSEKVANEAADATKALKPTIVVDGYGGYYNTTTFVGNRGDGWVTPYDSTVWQRRY